MPRQHHAPCIYSSPPTLSFIAPNPVTHRPQPCHRAFKSITLNTVAPAVWDLMDDVLKALPDIFADLLSLIQRYSDTPSPLPHRPSTSAALACVYAWATCACAPISVDSGQQLGPAGSTASALSGLPPKLVKLPRTQAWGHDTSVVVLAGAIALGGPELDFDAQDSLVVVAMLREWLTLTEQLLAACAMPGVDEPGAPSSSPMTSGSSTTAAHRAPQRGAPPPSAARTPAAGAAGGGHSSAGQALAPEQLRDITEVYRVPHRVLKVGAVLLS